MKTSLSLKQSWMALILFAVIVPVTLVIIWYSQQIYTNQLDSALTIERQANESLRNQIESETKRFKTLLKNKGDPLSFLVDKTDNPDALSDINTLLGLIVEREQAIDGVIILSKQAEVIAAVDPGIGAIGDRLLSAEELQSVAMHWGFDEPYEYPEVVIPSLGRTYISSPRHHEDFIAFTIATPIGNPAKAVLIAEINADNLWPADVYKEHGIGEEKTRDYILDRRGSLITKIDNSDNKPGDLMTHLAITRTALIDGEWPVGASYIGVMNQPVFGTKTPIPSLNWTLISEVSVSSITQPIWDSLLKVILFALLGMVAFVWFVLYLANKTIKPIQHASDAIDYVAKGDYQYVLEPSGIRELDTMTAGFNNMAKARQSAENLLREREQDLAITLNSIGDAVITTDAEGNVTRMNPVAEQLTGWPLQEAKGQPLKTIFPIVNASTRETIANPVEKVIATGETVYLSNHTTLISRDHTEYQIADSAAPIRNGDDKVQGMVLVFNDVTEQYQLRQTAAKSKRDLQAIMDNSPAVIYVKDTEGRFTFLNQQFEKVFHRKHEDIIGKTLHDISPKDIADEMQHNDRAALEAGHALESEERAPHGDGFRNYLSVKFPLYDDDDKVYAVCSISTDITERKQQEEQLRRIQKMDALGKLTGGIAHDYNNMLGIVIGFSDLLKAELTDQPNLTDYVDEIRHAGERGVKLTQKLLAFSRHKQSFAQRVDINRLLQDEQHMLEKTLTVSIKVTMNLADELWPVWLDIDDLEDAILNISINAMHAMEGSGQLTFNTENKHIDAQNAGLLQLNAGDYVLLSIIDTGGGMDEATRQKIFDPFYSTKGEKGTGLGLSQVYGFAERSGGAIKVYSEPGQGSRFTLYFPRYTHDTEDQQIEIDGDADFRGHETILVVDDEPALLTLTVEILKQQGYKAIPATSAKEALEILENESIDLVLSDVIMPEMDGYQLAEIVQQIYPNVKIQLASGFSDDRHKNMVDDTLHQQMIHKPYNAQTLRQKIRELLDM